MVSGLTAVVFYLELVFSLWLEGVAVVLEEAAGSVPLGEVVLLESTAAGVTTSDTSEDRTS